jgi:CheY-like chemotaxis protein
VKKVNLVNIEDNKGDLALTQEALSELDCDINISTFKDGKQGLNYLEDLVITNKKYLPDLIVSDLNLPLFNGFKILKSINLNPLLRQIPVTVFSMSSFQNDINKAYDLQANCFVTKPSEPISFFNSIKDVMKFWIETTKRPSKKGDYN